jgi:hypothetical protein
VCKIKPFWPPTPLLDRAGRLPDHLFSLVRNSKSFPEHRGSSVGSGRGRLCTPMSDHQGSRRSTSPCSRAAMSSTAIGSSLRSVQELVISVRNSAVELVRCGFKHVCPRKKIVQDQFVRKGGHKRIYRVDRESQVSKQLRTDSVWAGPTYGTSQSLTPTDSARSPQGLKRDRSYL